MENPLEQLSKKLSSLENSKPVSSIPSGPVENNAERIRSSVARLTANSIGELQGLVSELQKMQEFVRYEVDSVRSQIDSALAGINVIVETIGPWRSIAKSDADRKHETLAIPDFLNPTKQFPKK